ncbi:MAG: 3-dehydroquinate synthase [Thermoanaerobaculia bacterium]|jgi:3-dehydroquinate synthase|nr:3-dehydroquinate synthase [Thermoanaerobaculia bacterium]
MTPFLTIRQASASYPVYVGRDLLSAIASLVHGRGAIFVITSAALRDRFGEQIAASLNADVIEIEEGESHKNLDTVNDVVTQLLSRGAKRDSIAVVVGGGMVGDTAGFAASIFLRGIDLVHVPTTLLAQVDSSLGGKLAVNHASGKNLIGSFFPPRAVISDLSTLDSLPRRELLSGLFEALKGGVIGDPSLFEMLESPPRFDVDDVVRKAIQVKAEIVSADEREADVRRLLNYGHTIGHGIEAALDYRDLTHGEAVAWGMIGANAIAVRRGILARDVAARIDRAIGAWNPAFPPASIDRAAILAAAEHDKKNTGSQRVMVFPHAIGSCDVFSDVTEAEIAFGVDAILEKIL